MEGRKEGRTSEFLLFPTCSSVHRLCTLSRPRSLFIERFTIWLNLGRGALSKALRRRRRRFASEHRYYSLWKVQEGEGERSQAGRQARRLESRGDSKVFCGMHATPDRILWTFSALARFFVRNISADLIPFAANFPDEYYLVRLFPPLFAPVPSTPSFPFPVFPPLWPRKFCTSKLGLKSHFFSFHPSARSQHLHRFQSKTARKYFRKRLDLPSNSMIYFSNI